MHREVDRWRIFTRRALLLGTGHLGLFGVLAGRLYQLQVVSADDYAVLADENRIQHRLLPPTRGRIFDRHGIPLAVNQPTYRVRLVPEQTRNILGTLASLDELIGLEPEVIERVATEARFVRPFVPIMVRDDLNWDEVARIAVHGPDLPGITLESGLLRHYPVNEALAHTLGYVGPVAESELNGDPLLELPEFRHGKDGIEKLYDPVLRGAAGHSRIEVNAIGREIKELYRDEGQPGADIRLTIDLDLQRFTHERLAEEESASAVVLNVHTGEVLALLSVPAFDPSAFTNGLTQATWRSLVHNPKAPLVNKAVRGLYPPGSTFKMMVALAALETGVIGPDHEVFCPGHMSLGRSRFHCWKEWGHGKLTLVQALAQSCDVYFYDIARRVGVDAIAGMARRFGLGHELGIDLPGERRGLVPDKAWKRAALNDRWHPGETLIVGIGQGFLQTTPLQLAVMAARLANGKVAVRPWLVTPPEQQPEPLGVSAWSLRFAREGMFEVVNGDRGTARRAQLDFAGVTMAGKTGTSQVRRISRAERATGVRKNEEKPWEERDHALFVAFAPYHEPRYAVAVVVEHGGSGSKAAAPIAKDLMSKVLELDPARGRAVPTAIAPRGVPGSAA